MGSVGAVSRQNNLKIAALRVRGVNTSKYKPFLRSPACERGQEAIVMTTVSNVAPAGSDRSGRMPTGDRGEGLLSRLGLRFTNWAERFFPDAYVFVAVAVAVVAAAALINGASAVAVATSFGDGFWSLITFTMQMVMVVVSGYVVASSPPAAKLIDGLAACRTRVLIS
jgi:hypothetical protein